MPFTSSGYFLKTEIAGHEINLFKLSEMLSLTFILFWATLSYILDRYRKALIIWAQQQLISNT
jgi:hypothetical protein